MKTQFFTICARNYLAFACALGESVLQHHPESGFTIWLLDSGEMPELPLGISARSIKDSVDHSVFTDLILRYSILELATAVKPACMQRHFADGMETVIYIDPDIYVFRPLTEVFELLSNGAAGVLTPHLLAPLPRDGAHPDDLDIQRSGIYNLGFIALAAGSQADALLAWWWGWLQTHCFADPSTGVFTDQKWMNFAPVFWPEISVLRHPGYNVAYWNLPQRNIAEGQIHGEWVVNGKPLVFFHFSGFNPSKPQVLSKHQDRVEVKPWEFIGHILEQYAGVVKKFSHDKFSKINFPELVFENGVAFDTACRYLYQHKGMRRFANPLSTKPGGFYAWITEPVSLGDGGALTRYLKAVYGLRADVRQAFPDIDGADRKSFISWVKNSGINEMHLAPQLVGIQTDLGDIEDVAAPVGVNYVGYLRAEMGLGEAARGYVRALTRQGVKAACIDISDLTIHRTEDSSLDSNLISDNALAQYAINLVHVNADQLPVIRDYIGNNFFRGRFNIGVWAWETLDFPQFWLDRFRYLQEIWVGSSFMAEAIGRVSPVPVIVMPHVIDVPDSLPDRSAFDLDEKEFVFLFMFDFQSTPERKNPEAAIAAFRKAFSPDQPVRLIIKSMHGHLEHQALTDLRIQAGDARINFLDGTFDSERRYALLASCDAFLSLHRAEGFGLGIAEAMAMGKPVVATGWSGNMDFMTIANSLPVAYKMQALSADVGPYKAGTLWAEPDVDDAARLMRQLVDEPDLVARIGARARSDMTENFGLAALGERMGKRLRILSERFSEEVAESVPVIDTDPVPSRLRARLFLRLRPVWHSGLAVLPVGMQRRLRGLVRRLFLSQQG